VGGGSIEPRGQLGDLVAEALQGSDVRMRRVKDWPESRHV
jgi:hypothetical protein